MNPNVSNTASLVGRILLALMFITSGFGKITGFESTVGYVASKGLPLPQLGAIIAIIVELGGGIGGIAARTSRSFSSNTLARWYRSCMPTTRLAISWTSKPSATCVMRTKHSFIPTRCRRWATTVTT